MSKEKTHSVSNKNKKLWSTFSAWADLHNHDLPPANLTRLRAHVTDGVSGKYLDTMFETNFEIASFAVFRTATYRSLFAYMDQTPPYGYPKKSLTNIGRVQLLYNLGC